MIALIFGVLHCGSAQQIETVDLPEGTDLDESLAVGELDQDVLDFTNHYRTHAQDCGDEGAFEAVSQLLLNGRLTEAAQAHAEDMADGQFFSHTSSDGFDVSSRVVEAGYNFNYVGENIAMGSTSVESVLSGWMSSDGHCANIMNPNYEELGVGYAEDADGTTYWVQVFGKRLE